MSKADLLCRGVFSEPQSARTIHDRRGGAAGVPLRYTVEELKRAQRLGLVVCEHGKWRITNGGEE